MYRFNFLLLVCLGCFLTFTSAGQSEEAKNLLSSTIDQLKSADGYNGTFTMTVFFGHEIEYEEEGKILTSGQNILLDLTSHKYISDGKASWTYMKERNEVMINDVSEDDFSLYNPSTLLNEIFSGEFDYAITDKYSENGVDLVKLEIKPQDHESETAKIALVISTELNLPTNLTLFQKDGRRYVIEIENINLNEKIDLGQFLFNPKDYPDIIIEDLRLEE